MNDEDKEAFVSYMRENMPFSYYQSYQCQELSTWQAACEYKQKEIDKLKNDLLRDKQWSDYFAEKIRDDKVIIKNYEEMLNGISKIIEGFKL